MAERKIPKWVDYNILPEGWEHLILTPEARAMKERLVITDGANSGETC